MEGTDKFATRVTKAVVVGPMDGKKMAQTRGRFDRPAPLVDGQRVRTEETEIVHLTSAWGEQDWEAPPPECFTTFTARTFLQPQLQKACKASDKKSKGDHYDLVDKAGKTAQRRRRRSCLRWIRL